MARGRKTTGPRMIDRSRAFETINYAIQPEDPKAPHFKQDGAFFDIGGKYLRDAPGGKPVPAEEPAPKPAGKTYTRGVNAEDDTVDRKAKESASGESSDAARAAVLANFGMSDPLEEQRSAYRENAAADAAEREHAE